MPTVKPPPFRRKPQAHPALSRHAPLLGPLGGLGFVRMLVLLGREAIRTNVSLMASALAFFGLLGVFPALAVVITSFALWADPEYVEWLMSSLKGIMPDEAWTLVSAELQVLVQGHATQVSLGLVISLVIALWSARSASASVMEALSRIYRTDEQRSILGHELIVLLFTLGGLVFGVLTLAAVGFVPAILSWLPVSREFSGDLSFFRWPVIALFTITAFALLYRFGPYRSRPRWARILIGSGFATLLWLAGSALFSFYVARFASYDKTYGSIGAVIVLLMWFYVGALATLIGALLDAEMGRRAAQRR